MLEVFNLPLLSIFRTFFFFVTALIQFLERSQNSFNSVFGERLQNSTFFRILYWLFLFFFFYYLCFVCGFPDSIITRFCWLKRSQCFCLIYGTWKTFFTEYSSHSKIKDKQINSVPLSSMLQGKCPNIPPPCTDSQFHPTLSKYNLLFTFPYFYIFFL